MARKTNNLLAAQNDDVMVACDDRTSFGVEVTGTWSGTITFEVLNGGTWRDALVYSTARASVAATTTANVTRLIDTTACGAVRARMSSYTSGSAVIAWNGTQGVLTAGGGSGGVVDTELPAAVTINDTTITGTFTAPYLGALQFVYDANSNLWVRQRRMGDLSDGNAGGTYLPTGMVAYNGATFDRVRTANADAIAATGVLGAGLMVYNGATWDRVRGTTVGMSVIGSGATNLGKAEDAAHTTADTGVPALTVRNDSVGSSFLAGTDGDYQMAQSNNRGDTYVVSGNHGIAIPTLTLTRGANTTAYTIGDEVATASTAPTTATFARLNGGSGIIQGCQVIYSNAPSVTPSLVVGVFNATVTLAGDNAQLNLSDADHAKLVCWIPLTASQDGVYSAGARSTSGSLALSGVPAGGRPAHYVCGGSEKTLYVVVITLNAFTPIANSETLTITFDQETN